MKGCKEVKHETVELYIPEPGRRIRYYGDVVKVERVIPRVKAYRIRGVVRYGSIQIILPRECVGKPAYVIVYVLGETDKLGSEVIDEDQYRLRKERTPLIRVV